MSSFTCEVHDTLSWSPLTMSTTASSTPDILPAKKNEIITINSHSHNTSNPARRHVSRNENLLCRFFYEQEHQLNFPLFLRFLRFLSVFVFNRTALNVFPPDWNIMFYRLLLYKIQIHTMELSCGSTLRFTSALRHTRTVHINAMALVFISIKQEQ